MTQSFFGRAQALRPTHTHNYQRICRMDLYYYHTGTRKSQESFSSADKDLVLSPCCCLLCLAFEAACLLIEFIIPGLESLKNGFFSQWPGVTHPTAACTRPPCRRPTSPILDKQPFFSPRVTEILEPPALRSHPLAARGDGA